MGCLSGADCLFPLWLPFPACLGWGDGLVCSRLALLGPLFCERAWLCPRLGLFLGIKGELSHSLGCCLKLDSSDCPQGTQAWSLP